MVVSIFWGTQILCNCLILRIFAEIIDLSHREKQDKYSIHPIPNENFAWELSRKRNAPDEDKYKCTL